MPEPRLVPPLKVFVSYSHRDETLCDRFLVHLSQLKRDRLIEPWHDRRITAGDEWAGVIDANLNGAHIIILLVSADFLASDYCNDVEMECALERSDKGEARVVSIILRPCDWETSRFARLQALPKGGKPVVDWKTEDDGLLDAVKGVRQLVNELCAPSTTYAPAGVPAFQTTVRHHPLRWVAGLVFAAALLASLWLWSGSRRYRKQGTDLLNVGLYADAKQALQRAKELNPLDHTAGCGLVTIELNAIRSSREKFDQRLKEASQEFPNCAYLKVLTGDRKYEQGDRNGAQAEYLEATRLEPLLAEAYFDMGRILEVEGDPDSALKQYQRAAELSPETSRYHNNLADVYFRLGNYEQAIDEYGRVAEFPLAALEAARIYRLQGKLNDALGREEDAIRWLKEPSVQDAEAQRAWAVDDRADEQVRLARLDEKECYAELEQTVTTFLIKDDEANAATELAATLRKCDSRGEELKRILSWELHRLGSEVPGLTQRSDAFAAKFLTTSNPG